MITTKQAINALKNRNPRYKNVGRKSKEYKMNRTSFCVSKPNQYLIDLGRKEHPNLDDVAAVKVGIAVFRQMLKDEE